MQLAITIHFVEKRCYTCGAWWAVETDRNFACNECPVCAGAKVKKAREELAALERSAQALRGAITRSRRGKRES